MLQISIWKSIFPKRSCNYDTRFVNSWELPVEQMDVGITRHEISNHLGNVLASINACPVRVNSNAINGMIENFEPSLANIIDFCPFGILIQAQNRKSEVYPSGFNGKENDNEIKGVGNSLDFGARMYDSRLGRWMSLDPKFYKYPSLSPYQISDNNPILYVDRNGKEIFIHYKDENGNDAQFKYKPGIKPVNNKFVTDAIQALDYIYKVDGIPNKVINELSYSRYSIVNINSNAKKGVEIKTEATQIEATITWNPNIGNSIVDEFGNETGAKQSPATILAHELGHAFHFLNSFDEAGTDKGNDIPQFDNNEEKTQIIGIESDVAKFYCEGIRTNHNGNDIYTNGPISTIDIVSNVKIVEGKEVELKENDR